VVEEDGPKGFEAAVQGGGGVSEEVPADGIIHGGTSADVREFFGESLSLAQAVAQRVGKT
jgi:hypothetical protein